MTEAAAATMDLGSPVKDHPALSYAQQRIEQVLAAWLPGATHSPEKLHAAMRYSALGGGKRLRPALVYATGRMLGVPEDWLDVPAAAVELVHVYSLVHDDLPAMDDDDLHGALPCRCRRQRRHGRRPSHRLGSRGPQVGRRRGGADASSENRRSAQLQH